jgi:hypothetical protein
VCLVISHLSHEESKVRNEGEERAVLVVVAEMTRMDGDAANFGSNRESRAHVLTTSHNRGEKCENEMKNEPFPSFQTKQ